MKTHFCMVGWAWVLSNRWSFATVQTTTDKVDKVRGHSGRWFVERMKPWNGSRMLNNQRQKSDTAVVGHCAEWQVESPLTSIDTPECTRRMAQAVQLEW